MKLPAKSANASLHAVSCFLRSIFLLGVATVACFVLITKPQALDINPQVAEKASLLGKAGLTSLLMVGDSRIASFGLTNMPLPEHESSAKVVVGQPGTAFPPHWLPAVLAVYQGEADVQEGHAHVGRQLHKGQFDNKPGVTATAADINSTVDAFPTVMHQHPREALWAVIPIIVLQVATLLAQIKSATTDFSMECPNYDNTGVYLDLVAAGLKAGGMLSQSASLVHTFQGDPLAAYSTPSGTVFATSNQTADGEHCYHLNASQIQQDCSARWDQYAQCEQHLIEHWNGLRECNWFLGEQCDPHSKHGGAECMAVRLRCRSEEAFDQVALDCAHLGRRSAMGACSSPLVVDTAQEGCDPPQYRALEVSETAEAQRNNLRASNNVHCFHPARLFEQQVLDTPIDTFASSLGINFLRFVVALMPLCARCGLSTRINSELSIFGWCIESLLMGAALGIGSQLGAFEVQDGCLVLPSDLDALAEASRGGTTDIMEYYEPHYTQVFLGFLVLYLKFFLGIWALVFVAHICGCLMTFNATGGGWLRVATAAGVSPRLARGSLPFVTFPLPSCPQRNIPIIVPVRQCSVISCFITLSG